MKKLFALILILSCVLSSHAEDLDSLYTQEMLRYGTEAPDFMIDSISNTSLKSMRGRYVVLHFWASWCPDCRKDIPEINRLHEEFASDSVIFIHISFDTDKEKWLKYIDESDMEGLQLCEFVKMKESKTANVYGIKWIPSMYVLNTEGKVILRTVMIEKLRRQLSHLDLSKVNIPRSKRASSPSFPGGENALKVYLAQNVEYPRKASNYGLEGQTVFRFIVNTDGSISNVRVVSNKITVEDKLPFQKLAGDEKRKLREEVLSLFAEEGKRVINKMPRWKPGVRYGMPIKAEYEMPLNFKIQYNNY
jgi:thiol-disulfide isomerase/thioredoxin